MRSWSLLVLLVTKSNFYSTCDKRWIFPVNLMIFVDLFYSKLNFWFDLTLLASSNSLFALSFVFAFTSADLLLTAEHQSKEILPQKSRRTRCEPAVETTCECIQKGLLDNYISNNKKERRILQEIFVIIMIELKQNKKHDETKSNNHLLALVHSPKHRTKQNNQNIKCNTVRRNLCSLQANLLPLGF